MNAGKSTMLLQSNHNYLERGMKPQIYTSDLDNRYGSGEIVSRIGLKAKSNTFNTKTDIYEDILNKNNNDSKFSVVSRFLSLAISSIFFETSKTFTDLPAFIKFSAIGQPMLPTPINAIKLDI